ncbi:Glycosyltransferase involved in cell wall bisynthesis [Candidatus Methanophagaceae archaeon]|nr:Glycosyltransferase involved in cell wall bisynthesis [Methanophagales archaeon]
MIPLILPLAIALTTIIAVVYITYCYAFITAKNGDLKCVSKYPHISIVLPAYNEGKAIEGRINNIAQSDYSGELELIIVSDASIMAN